MIMSFIACLASAQDVIITKDSKKIEAQIIEVSQTEIRYKEVNNLNGPTFVIATNQINSIIYANGTVSTFNQNNQTTGNVGQNSNIASGAMMTKTGDTYFYNGRAMSEAEYVNFIQTNCVQAWQSYQSGKNLTKTGWALFGAGMGCIVVSIPLAWAPYSLYYDPILWGVGGGLTIGSIPCLIVGTVRKNNSYEVFNQQCSRTTTALEFGIQTSQNGIGLAMKF